MNWPARGWWFPQRVPYREFFICAGTAAGGAAVLLIDWLVAAGDIDRRTPPSAALSVGLCLVTLTVFSGMIIAADRV